ERTPHGLACDRAAGSGFKGPSRKSRKQGLGFLEVARIEAFGEPRVHWGEQIARRGALALLLPEARQARRGAQLIGAGAVFAGDIERTRVTGSGFLGRSTQPEEPPPAHPMAIALP